MRAEMPSITPSSIASLFFYRMAPWAAFPLLLVGCASETTSRATATVRDSAGIVIAENDGSVGADGGGLGDASGVEPRKDSAPSAPALWPRDHPDRGRRREL